MDNSGARVGALVNPSGLSGRTPQSRQSAKRFLQSSELGLPHPFNLRRSVPPHPLVRGGHTRLRERGWGSTNSDEVTYTTVLYIYKYFVSHSLTCLLVGPEVALTARQAHNHACAVINFDFIIVLSSTLLHLPPHCVVGCWYRSQDSCECSVRDPWHFGADPDPYLWLMDPDPGGPKTRGSCGYGLGFGATTLVATTALAVRSSNHSARSYPLHTRQDLIQMNITRQYNVECDNLAWKARRD